MTLGEKIAKQRKENNYTQEQLADLLGVSRQSVSKWESDLAYPETDKLIRLGKLFECSMDYLLNEDCTDKSGKNTEEIVSVLDTIHSAIKRQCRERKSKKISMRYAAVPHRAGCERILCNRSESERSICIWTSARGIVSLGLLSLGIISVGLLSVGLIAFGTAAFGLLSVGSIALGLFAVGAISIGIVSFGALSIGGFSSGALAIGKYVAVGDHARAMIAIGGSEAVGNVYQHIGGLTSTDVAIMIEWLDANVPAYLSWAKEIFTLYLR